MANTFQNDLLSSLVSDIKAYTGPDPLHPWLRGIQKMKESLPPHILKQKLPRYLQKCLQTFETDCRYKNDLRYLRVWIQLMDYVDDPRGVLRTMEMNKIGTKQALFYKAHALYYEKLKKFEEADKMYHLGVHNLAQPTEELQKSYEQFLHRMEQRKRRKARREEIKAGMTARNYPSEGREAEGIKVDMGKGNSGSARSSSSISSEEPGRLKSLKNKKVMEGNSTDTVRRQAESKPPLPQNFGIIGSSSGLVCDPSGSKEVIGGMHSRGSSNQQEKTNIEAYYPSTLCSDETVFVKFVDTAIVGKSDAEEACHHGLVDPTINMKEAMNAINSMFREPLELEPAQRRNSRKSQPKVDQKLSSGLEVFVDESMDNGVSVSHPNKENGCPAISKRNMMETKKPKQAAFEIFVDDESMNGTSDGNDENNSIGNHEHEVQPSTKGSASQVSAFVFPRPCDSSDDQDTESPPHLRREDTVVGRFVGSTILDEPEGVENACHHGLVDPTINLKEAMDAINSMFGKPIDFVRANRPKKHAKVSEKKADFGGFSILPDDDFENQTQKPQASSGLPSKLVNEPNRNRDCGGFSILPDDDFEDEEQPPNKLKREANKNIGGFTILPDSNLENQQPPRASSRLRAKLDSENDLFEPTVFTKQALDDINEMFGKPLDF